MCFPPGARPPEIPEGLRPIRPISGGAGSEDAILTSADGATFRARVATAAHAEHGVVIAPDVRGLHSFYEELSERFASAGVHAIAIDYFGRTAGTDRRPDDFAFREHVAQTKPEQIQADIGAAVAELRRRTRAHRIYVLGFCMGGRVAFNASADQQGIAGVIGFYGVTRRRDANDASAPIDKVVRMHAPVLGLFGGGDQAIPPEDNSAFDKALAHRRIPHELVTYPNAPHSFFDRSFAEWNDACDDSWRRVLGFISTGEPGAVG
ncbi:MAG TPA: dienelactone hydrolase family protein [Candidatus Limnocylindria bacterium]|nr:dienelactone hydrolase family protein [Candidatus Limnocylindria bacterium]